MTVLKLLKLYPVVALVDVLHTAAVAITRFHRHRRRRRRRGRT